LKRSSSREQDGETNGLITALGTRSHGAAVQTIESAAESEIGPSNSHRRSTVGRLRPGGGCTGNYASGSQTSGLLKEIGDPKAGLLRVLDRPEAPLHNNALESDIREFVKRRKLSGGTRNDAGRRCRDTFASLKKTCRKLGVRFWDYLQDRVRGLGKIPRLAGLIRQKARQSTATNRQAVPAN
jgi:hypothetical protein